MSIAPVWRMPTAQCARRRRVMCAARLALCCEYLSNTQQQSQCARYGNANALRICLPSPGVARRASAVGRGILRPCQVPFSRLSAMGERFAQAAPEVAGGGTCAGVFPGNNAQHTETS